MTYDQLRQLSLPELLSLLESTIKHAQEYSKGLNWSPGATTLMPKPALLEIGDFEIRARFNDHGKEESSSFVPISDTLYSELIMSVESKFPGENRHQTALRYIREAEKFMEGKPAQSKSNL